MGHRLSGAIITCLVVWAVMAFVYPDQLITHSTRFMNLMDTEINYENTYTVASQIARGHIDMFNVFDGFGFAYSQLTTGVYGFTNICVALIYLALSHFVDDKAQFFHQCYSVLFFSINILLRTLGCYLLAGFFTKRLSVKIIAAIYLNVIMMQYLMNNGLMVNNLFSYLPLVLFFLIRAVDRLSWRDLMMFLLVMAVAINNGLLGALGYFYLVIHPVLIGAMMWLLLFKRQHVIQSFAKLTHGSFWQHHARFNLIVFGLMVALFIPLFFWAKELAHQFYIANSGLGGTEGRLSYIFNISKYFNFPGRSYTDPSGLLTGLVDYRFPAWGWSWPFISAGGLLLAFLGVAFVRHWSLVVCALSFIWVVCLNIPTYQGMGIDGFAHWINVLTNPVQFLVRSFHMANLLSIILLFPLIVAGFDGLVALINKEAWASYRLRVLIAVLVITTIASMFLLTKPVLWYVLVTIVLLAVAAALSMLKSPINKMAWLSLLILVGVDVIAVKHYVVGDLMKDRAIIKEDWRAPGDFTWQASYRNEATMLEPKRYGYLNTFGYYYGFYPTVERFTRAVSLYEPRHVIFKDLPLDPDGVAYLMRDNQLMFLADVAVSDKDVSLRTLINQDLDRRIAIVSATADASTGILKPSEVSISKQGTHAFKMQTKPVFHPDSLEAKVDINQQGWFVVHWPFDSNWQLSVDGIKQHIFKANTYFMAFPLTKGEHQINLVYAPYHPLRIIVWVMMLAVILSVIVLFKEGYSEDQHA